MKKMLLIMLLVVVTLMGRGYSIELKNYETEIERLEAENAELQDNVFELDSEIKLLVEDADWRDLPVYDDTVDYEDEAEWASWDNLRD